VLDGLVRTEDVDLSRFRWKAELQIRFKW